MKMTHSRIEQISEGIGNRAFGEQTEHIEIMLHQAVVACNGDFWEVNHGYTTGTAKAFWDATISMVKALKPELLSPNRIPRKVMEIVENIHSSVYGLERNHLYKMEDNFGFLPYMPHGRTWLYDRDCEGLNETAHVDTIAMTRANHTKNRLIKAYREGAWDGRKETLGSVFATEIMHGCYGPEDCR